MKQRITALFLIFVCLFCCGCNNETSEAEQTAEEVLIPAVTSSEEEEPQPYPVIINDTVIESAPLRVVSLSPSITEILFEMGYGNTVVGRGSYCDYPYDVTEIIDVGRPTKPDYDAIISLEPDLLLTATAIPVKEQYRLEERGIKTVFLNYPDSVEQFCGVYKAIGFIYEGLFNGESKGEEAFSSVKTILDNKDLMSLGDFIYVTEGLAVATGDTLESSVFSCFGTNLAAEGKNYVFPKDYLTTLQPDIILLGSGCTIDELKNDEVFSKLEAVQNEKIFLVDNIYFERPSARIGYMLTSLSDEIK